MVHTMFTRLEHGDSRPAAASACSTLTPACAAPPEEAEERNENRDMFVLVRTHAGSIGYINMRCRRSCVLLCARLRCIAGTCCLTRQGQAVAGSSMSSITCSVATTNAKPRTPTTVMCITARHVTVAAITSSRALHAPADTPAKTAFSGRPTSATFAGALSGGSRGCSARCASGTCAPIAPPGQLSQANLQQTCSPTWTMPSLPTYCATCSARENPALKCLCILIIIKCLCISIIIKCQCTIIILKCRCIMIIPDSGNWSAICRRVRCLPVAFVFAAAFSALLCGTLTRAADAGSGARRWYAGAGR